MCCDSGGSLRGAHFTSLSPTDVMVRISGKEEAAKATLATHAKNEETASSLGWCFECVVNTRSVTFEYIVKCVLLPV